MKSSKSASQQVSESGAARTTLLRGGRTLRFGALWSVLRARRVASLRASVGRGED